MRTGSRDVEFLETELRESCHKCSGDIAAQKRHSSIDVGTTQYQQIHQNIYQAPGKLELTSFTMIPPKL